MAVAVGTRERLTELWEERPGLASFFTSVDHKRIGTRYLVTAFAFFVAGGVEALIMRTQLAAANGSLVSPEVYDQLFSMHGTTMIFLFVTPMLSGFSNFLIPLMIGARDMAFPRLNAFSYWVFALAGALMYSSFLSGSAPNAGWTSYTPLTTRYDGGPNIDYWTLGLIFLSVATTAGAINLIVTILKLRAPGMSVARMPLFVWAVFVTSWMMVFALPPLTLGNILLTLDRHLGTSFFEPAGGGDPILWQHLFWVFGHPDVYIIFLPAVGIVSSVVATFSRRPIVAYRLMVFATVVTGILGFGVWVHHMFATGLPRLSLTFFAAASIVIAVPSGIQVFAWIATILHGRPVFTTAFLFAVGFVVVFVIGGVTGVMFASVPFDQQTTDSYFVVAHFHYVLFGGAVFPIFAGLHYWFPKITGRLLSEGLGRLTFWLVFVGFNLAFFPMHVLGLQGMPRRVYTYPGDMGWGPANLISTVGAFTLATGVLVFLANAVWSIRRGAEAPADPWGGGTLEWATESPPAPYNFPAVPIVTDRDPLWAERRSGPALDEGRLLQETSVNDADVEPPIPAPEESAMPLVAAIGLVAVFAGLLAGAVWPVVAGLAVAIVGAFRWAWTTAEIHL
jgi:cytochrome c oxidase subunit I+III